MAKQTKSFCRICSAHCGMVLTVSEDDHILDIRGDRENPLSRGYACFKGLQAEDAHHGKERILRPLKKQPNGTFAEIGLESALDEIAERLRAVMAERGPDAVAIYNGNGGTPDSAGYPMAAAFMKAIESQSTFSSLTIDQSAKIVAAERQGFWAAGLQDMSQSDVVLIVGSNPLVSHSTLPVMTMDPTKRMKDAKAQGLKLIVIDPRRTETAKHADLQLQPYPGKDAAILAAIIRIILHEGWEDAMFCAEHVGVARMTELRNAMEPFTPEFAAHWAGLTQGEIHAAAAMFARDNKRGAAYAATGTCMAPFSNLAQHLVETLNIICGRVRRAGDSVIVDMSSPDGDIYAEVIPPPRSWTAYPPGRIRGVGRINGEKLTGTMADEILVPGEGQVRAMIVNGGNPAVSVPDQQRIVTALQSLELLVAVEPYMTATASLADYIIPPRMQYERCDLPLLIPGYPLYADNWMDYTSAVLEPPLGSDVAEEWYVFWSLIKRLGRQAIYAGHKIDMGSAPTAEGLIALRLKGSRVDFDKLRNAETAMLFGNDTWKVKPARQGQDAKFDVMPSDVAEEVCQFLKFIEQPIDASFSYTISTRRLKEVFNSNGTQMASVKKRFPDNPAFVHPDDLSKIGAKSGDFIDITSGHGKIRRRAREDDSMRHGVISISHCWGKLPHSGEDDVNLLIDSTHNVEAVNAMPWMSGLPVKLEKV